MPKKYYCANPTYVVVVGDPSTNQTDIFNALTNMVEFIKGNKRNPVLYTVSSPISDYISEFGKMNSIPTVVGSNIADLMSDLDGRKLKADHKRIVIFQTPEYAGSNEALQTLYCTKAIEANLHMYSNYHHMLLNGIQSNDWVRQFNNKFLKTLKSYSMSDDEKKQLFSRRIKYLYKFAPEKLLATKYR